MSNIERILNGDKEALVAEICDIVEWARALTAKEWECITNDRDGGLNGVIGRIVDSNVTTDEADDNKIYDICLKVTQITDAEVQEIRDIAQGQLNYLSPLRMATTAHQNALGRHNMAVLDALLKLKEVIESGAHLFEE